MSAVNNKFSRAKMFFSLTDDFIACGVHSLLLKTMANLGGFASGFFLRENPGAKFTNKKYLTLELAAKKL